MTALHAILAPLRRMRRRHREAREAAGRKYGRTLQRAALDDWYGRIEVRVSDGLAQLDDDLDQLCPWCTDKAFPDADKCTCTRPCGRGYCKAAEVRRG